MSVSILSFLITRILPSIISGFSVPAPEFIFFRTVSDFKGADMNSAGLSGILSGVVMNPATADAAQIGVQHREEWSSAECYSGYTVSPM